MWVRRIFEVTTITKKNKVMMTKLHALKKRMTARANLKAMTIKTIWNTTAITEKRRTKR